VLLGGVARASDWWVAPPPAGSDSNAGSSTTPLATLGAAAGRAQPGDTIHVRAGSYAGARLTLAGSATAPIRIVSEDGPRLAILQGSAEPLALVGAAFLTIDGFEVRASGDHAVLVDQSHDVTLSSLFAHDAGLGGDAISIARSRNITLDGVEAARPGRTMSGVPPFQPCVEIFQSSDSTVRRSFIHDGGGVLLSVHGGSQNIVLDANVIAQQRDDGDAPPAVALGDATDPAQIGAAQYEAIAVVLRNSIVLDAAHGAVGIADANGAYLANDLFLDVAQAGVELRAGSAALHRSDDVRVADCVFADTRGKMPQPYLKTGDAVGAFAASFDVYWNAGAAIPPAGAGVPLAVPEPGALDADPRVAPAQVFASWSAAVAALAPGAGGAAGEPGLDTSGAPFGVTDDITGAARGASHDRGPYLVGEAPDGGADDGGGGGGGSGGGGGGGILPPRSDACSCRTGARAPAVPLGAIAVLTLFTLLLRRRHHRQ